MSNIVYDEVRKFKKKYPWTISWRLKAHCKIVSQHLGLDEKVKYVFAAQKGDNHWDIINTYVVVMTNKRLVLGRKRLLFGYFFTSITPDLFNDLKVKMGIIWGLVYIDTIKELVILSNVQKKALPEIEKEITEHMIREKKKYGLKSTELTDTD